MELGARVTDAQVEHPLCQISGSVRAPVACTIHNQHQDTLQFNQQLNVSYLREGLQDSEGREEAEQRDWEGFAETSRALEVLR